MYRLIPGLAANYSLVGDAVTYWGRQGFDGFSDIVF